MTFNPNRIDYGSDAEHSINGILGRLTRRTRKPGMAPALWLHQEWKATRRINGHETLTVCIQFDDELGNGHNTFRMTAEHIDPTKRGEARYLGGGMMHEEIARVFPQLAPLIPWHLCTTDGPAYYPGNTIFFAGDRDCWGLRKGESRQLRNGKTGQPAWQLAAIVDGEQRAARVSGVPQYVDSDTQPEAPAGLVYAPWLRVGEGKERELDLARQSAIWPNATDEELSASPDELRAKLQARLPALLEDFHRVIRACGFYWSAEDYPHN